jgi:hypothetical protein
MSEENIRIRHQQINIITLVLAIIVIIETIIISILFTNLSHENTISASNKKESKSSQEVKFSAKNVSIIGDSITFLAKNTILKTIPDLKEENINAKNGRLWHEGIEIAEKDNKKLKKTVVFALGTNSTPLKEKDITEALDAIGMDKNIILTTNYTLEKNYYYNNKLFRKFAKEYKNIYLADWSKAIRDNPTKYLEPDPIHPNSIGEVIYAKTILKTLKTIKDL